MGLNLMLHHNYFSAVKRAVMRDTLMLKLILLAAESQDSVHKPQVLKRKESRSGDSN